MTASCAGTDPFANMLNPSHDAKVVASVPDIDVALIANDPVPVNEQFGNPGTPPRETVWLSRISDPVTDGVAWSAPTTIEEGPGEYSYPAMIVARDGTVHLTYTWRRERIRHVELR